MAFTLEQVVPWGRSYEEYVNMFRLTEADLALNILGCSDGPAGFNKGMKEHGQKMLSIDPLYEFRPDQIRIRIDETYEDVMAQLLENSEGFVWSTIPSPQELGRLRMAAMQDFLDDFVQGKEEGRYRSGELPKLPLHGREFDLALCSHFLFLYSKHLSFEFHRDSIKELCRVAKEVRIFPLLNLAGDFSRYVEPIVAEFSEQGYTVSIESVDYEVQRGGNQMMRISQ